MAKFNKGLVTFTFDVEGEKQVDAALGIVDENINDLRGLWPDIRPDFFAGEKTQFKTQGGSGSGGWPKLSIRYAAWKKKKYPGRKILVLKGDLKRSLTEKGDANHVYKPGKKGLEIGTKDPKAVYHQSPKPRTSNLPRRPPVELTKAQRLRWLKLMHEYIVKSGQGFVQKVLKF